VSATVAALWEELVTVGLLGTDRRDPPEMPPGPVADVVDDALAPTPAARLLTAVAAVTVARRAGVTAGPALPTLLPPEPDRRPMLPLAATRRWYAIVANWPILEGQWLDAANAAGWRPSPDVLVAMLRRASRTPIRRGAVMSFGGELAAWLVDQLPELTANGSRTATTDSHDSRPVPGELRAAFALPADEFASIIVSGLLDGAFRWAHRGVLLNTVAAMPVDHLPALIDALGAGRREQESRSARGQAPAVPLGLWEALLELADVRRTMLDELADPGEPGEPGDRRSRGAAP
jgi:hypothetical protein